MKCLGVLAPAPCRYDYKSASVHFVWLSRRTCYINKNCNHYYPRRIFTFVRRQRRPPPSDSLSCSTPLGTCSAAERRLGGSTASSSFLSSSSHSLSTTTRTTTTPKSCQTRSLFESYKDQVARGEITPDSHQERAMVELDRLYQDLQDTQSIPFSPSSLEDEGSVSSDHNNNNNTHVYYWLKLQRFVTHAVAKVANVVRPPSRSSSRRTIRGVYMHGGVGCGKTFCMNLFYHHVMGLSLSNNGTIRPPPTVTTTTATTSTTTTTATPTIQKTHFYKFMLDVHQQMHQARYANGIKSTTTVTTTTTTTTANTVSILDRVVDQILKRGRILCFDEFQVTNVADALILRRLFTKLWERGAVVVATSNRPPTDLYLNGLQRELFLPFIDLLQEQCHIVSLWDSDTDYRLIQAEQKAQGVYFVNNDDTTATPDDDDKDDAFSRFQHVFYTLVKGRNVVATFLMTQGRKVPIPMSCLSSGIARFSFSDLCTKALGAADYLVIGQHFHTVFVSHVPCMTLNELNYLRRFITFVDVMYECHVKLIVHAADVPSNLFQVDLANQFHDEVFAFDRTRSRLEEMGSDEYLQKRWAGKKKLQDGTSSCSEDATTKVEWKVLLEPSLSDNTVDAEPPIGSRGVG